MCIPLILKSERKMSRVDFYHLQKQTLEEVLPKLLLKAYETDKKIKLMVGTPERVEFINSLLWTFDDESFLPHGTKKDGFCEKQPIYISADEENPNNAEFIFLIDGAFIETEKLNNFERIFNIFDGNVEESLEFARSYWKKIKVCGADLHYWQQSLTGKWEQKI